MASVSLDFISLLESSWFPRYILLLAGLSMYFYMRKSTNSLADIPTVGRTNIFGSYADAIHNIKHANKTVKEGYEKFTPRAFKFPEMSRWNIVISSAEHLKEYANASEHILSFSEGVNDTLAINSTLGDHILKNNYHADILRNKLNRNLSLTFKELEDEILSACNAIIPVTEDWISVPILNAATQINCRSANRVFVGEPICRHPEFIKSVIDFGLCLSVSGFFVGLLPSFLRPFAARYLTTFPKHVRKTLKHLDPVIAERKKCLTQYGKSYPDKPNNLITWLLDQADEFESSSYNVTLRVLMTNFSTIHTSTLLLLNALFELATRPEYIEPLREEIENVVAMYGWEKDTLEKMHKLDSFMRESRRIHGFSALSMTRKVMRDFIFSDGTKIPKGSQLSAILLARQTDTKYFLNPMEFHGFRFVSDSKTQDVAGDDDMNKSNQVSFASTENLSFGLGRHVCPGRFFSTIQQKRLLAHILLTYDLEMDNKPDPDWFGTVVIPNQKAEIRFRKRR